METTRSNFCVAGIHFDHHEIQTHFLPAESIHTVALNPNGLDVFFQKLTEIDKLRVEGF
jgi:hypothetical protein